MSKDDITTFDYSVANDNGNSEHSIIINDTLILQPNVNAEVDSLPWIEEQRPESLIPDLHNNIIVTIDSPITTGMFYIGQFALESGEVVNNIQVGIDNKADIELPIVNTLGQIAVKAIQDYYKHTSKAPIDKVLKVSVDMTTALPITQHNKDTAARFEGRFMQGFHTVKVHLGNTYSVDVEIDFEYVKAIPEATPVTFSIQRDLSGNWRHDEIFDEFKKRYNGELPINFDGRYFADKLLLHVDIGDGTTEYPVTKGNKFLPQFVHGSNHGAGHAIEEALDDFNNSILVPDSPRQFLSDVIKDESHKYYERAANSIKKPVEVQTKQIIRNIKQQLAKSRNMIDAIVVYGGGSILLRSNLETELNKLCNDREIKLFYVPSDYANVLNVEGLGIFCNSAIFQGLKARNAKVSK